MSDILLFVINTKRSELKEKIKKVTEGVLSEIVDLVLWEIAYIGASTVNFSRTTWQARVAADRFLAEVNYETIKNTLEQLRRKGFIERPKHKKAWPQITAEGRKRLKSMLPFYDEKRSWDGRIYLMTYDIPEARKKDRELLRHFAKKLGMGMLQESVWITPYNPREVLADFIHERNLKGTIVVSDIGKDGAVGDENLKTLLARVYKLDKLNKCYMEFVRDAKAKRLKGFVEQQFAFLSILNDDPQLPWDLLPADWHGDEAYKVYKKAINNSKFKML